MGERPFRIEEGFNFKSCLVDCHLQGGGYPGDSFIWSDNRDHPNIIWKRLDRLSYNVEWFNLFGRTTITHISRACSGHASFLIDYGPSETDYIKYFKFLNMWVEHDKYREVIEESWSKKVQANSLYILHQKSKKVCRALSLWSKNVFGDIYEEPKRL